MKIFMIDSECNQVLADKYPDCEIEILNASDWQLDKLIEYILDDIFVVKPYSVRCFQNMFRFMIRADNVPDKIYYINDISDEDLKLIHAGLLKFAWKTNFNINVFKNVDPLK